MGPLNVTGRRFALQMLVDFLTFANSALSLCSELRKNFSGIVQFLLFIYLTYLTIKEHGGYFSFYSNLIAVPIMQASTIKLQMGINIKCSKEITCIAIRVVENIF